MIFTDPVSSNPGVKEKEREFAGIIGMISTDPHTMMSEPGWIVILPQYQVSEEYERRYTFESLLGYATGIRYRSSRNPETSRANIV